MLLTSMLFRDRDHPRTLSFVETMALTRSNLASVCARFPDLSRRMRRNQIKLALRRAVVHINRGIKERGTRLELRPSFDQLFKQEVDQRFTHSDDLQPQMCSLLSILRRQLSVEAAAHTSTATSRTTATEAKG